MDRHTISWSPIYLEDTWAGINSKPGTLGTCTSLCPLWVRGNRKQSLSWCRSESTAPLELRMLRKHLRLEEIITISISILKWCFDSVCVLSVSVNNYKVLTQCAVPKLPHSRRRAGARACTRRSLESSSLDLNERGSMVQVPFCFRHWKLLRSQKIQSDRDSVLHSLSVHLLNTPNGSIEINSVVTFLTAAA